MLPRILKVFGRAAKREAALEPDAAPALDAIPERDANLERARALAAQGRLAEASSVCAEILERDQGHVDALMLRAEIEIRQGAGERALELYSGILERSPDYAPAHYKRANLLKDHGQLEAAIAGYDRAIALEPKHAFAFCNRGAVLDRLGRNEQALASYDRALELNPNDPFAHCNRGSLLRRLGQPTQALASYELAIAAKPDYAEAHFNRGSLLAELGRSQEALSSYHRTIEFAPGFPQAYLHRGQLLRQMGQPVAALADYDKAIEVDPRFAEAHKYRGVLLYERQQFDAALESYTKTVELDPTNAEAFYNRGLIFHERKQLEAAMADYERAIALVPHFAEAHLNRGGALYLERRLEAALASFTTAAELDPSYTDAFLNLGRVLLDLGRLDAALESLDRAIALDPSRVEAHKSRGDTLSRMKRLREAIASYDRVHQLDPQFTSLRRTNLRMLACDWAHFASDIEQVRAEIIADRPLSSSIQSLLALVDDPALQLRAARLLVSQEWPPDGTLGDIPPRPRRDKIRVGYYSPDFRWHSVARLTANLFEIHDRSRFEIVAFAFGPAADDHMRKRLERAFDRFIDVRDRSDLQIAALSRELEIDIAVDLAGYTEYCRPRIFALRAAPIQVGYIGYLGTMGAPYMDYIIADPTFIPASRQGDYSEKIIYLPWYQVNDSKREMSKRVFTRAELGLPPSGVVFSCFSTLYKLQPSTFDTWMRILRRVPGATLFVIVDNPTTHQNLISEARRRGIAPERIVFGTRLEVDDYLARCKTIDLCLDTWPYTAGTTASDVLWAGLPILTRQGASFASRCAASMLRAVGLPELITDSPQQYEDLAVELGSDPERLKAIRQRLGENRDTCSLFDTVRFARNLEDAYRAIHERHCAGASPAHLNEHLVGDDNGR